MASSGPANRLNWELAKAAGSATATVGRAFWEIAKAFRGGRAATPVPFESTLTEEALSDLLRQTTSVTEGGRVSFEVWFDVRTVPGPRALVMLGDDLVGRSRVPGSEKVDLRAAARDDQFATGSLDVHASGCLLLVDGLSYNGLADLEDLEDVEEDEEDA